MPYICVELAGKKSFGGFLSIDNGTQFELFDDRIIYVDEGTHYISFSSLTTAQRNATKLNMAVGNYRTAAWNERDAVDGQITETFDENDVMFFTVVSDDRGHILDQPKYVVRELADDKIKELDAMYQEQCRAIAEVVGDDKKSAGVELILCIFLGFIGVHKFYKKKIGMGILYLFTGGLFGIGVLVDMIVLIIRMVRKTQ